MVKTFYLSKAEKNYVNSNEDVIYFLTEIDLEEDINSQTISDLLKKRAAELNLDHWNEYYSTVVAIWEGGLYEQYNQVVDKLKADRIWIPTYYNGLIKKYDMLSIAVDAFESGNVILHKDLTLSEDL
jgi:hypothetical protein